MLVRNIRKLFVIFFMVCFLFSFSFNDVYALNGMSRPNVKASSVTYNRVKIYWNNVKSAKGYAVYKYNSKSKKYTYLTSTSKNYVVTGKRIYVGKRNYYKVRAYKISKGKKIYSSYSKRASVVPKFGSPSLGIQSVNYNRVKLSWSKVSNTSFYEVYKYNGKKYKYLSRVNGNSLITSSKIDINKRNYYKVRACKKVKRKKLCGNFSKSMSIIPRLGTPRIGYVNKYSSNSVIMSWGRVSDVSGYEIYKHNSSGKYEYIGSTGNEYFITGYKLGDVNKTYYRIRAYRVYRGNKIYSNYSNNYSFVVSSYFNINNLRPKLSLKGVNPMSVIINNRYVEPGYSAIDNEGNDITSSVKISGTVNYNKIGVYYVNYRVSDKNGNVSSVSRRVVVSSVLVSSIELNSSVINVDTNGKGVVFVKNVLPSNSSHKDVSYYSSDTAIATVDQNGNVTGKKEGSASIIVAALDGSGVKTTCKVNVKDVKVTGITLSDSSATLIVGNTKQLSVKAVKPSNATNKGVTWSSSDSSIATVSSSGLVTGKKNGTVNIIATAKDGSGIKSVSKFTVNKIAVTSVKLNHAKAITEIGSKVTMNATVSPSTATYKTVTWSSSNTSVATVSSSGVVTGKGAGSAILKAVADGKSVSIPIYVSKVGDKLYAIDVEDYDTYDGSGDCLLFQSKNSSGKKIYGLVDTGRALKVDRVLSYFKDIGVSELDFVLITHFHGDHYGGLKKFYSSGIKIKNLYIKKYVGLDSNYRSPYTSVDEYRTAHVKNWNSYVSLMSKNSTMKYVSGSTNASISLGNFKFKLYNTGSVFSSFAAKCKSTAKCNENTNAIVSLVTVLGKTFYLSSDIANYDASVASTNNQKNYVYYWANKIMTDNKLSGISVVKAAHHGVVGNNPQDALTKLKGQYAFITEYKEYVSKNRASTVSRLKTSGISESKIYYSGSGTIVFNVDSNKSLSILQYAGEGCNKVAGCS